MSGPASDVNSKTHFIRAGAGAGKTTELIKNFLEFAIEFHQINKRFPKVVITTFTRKATQEVKERLLVSALKNYDRSVFEYINKKSYVHISTIHGLLSLYLSQHADLLNLPTEIKIIDVYQHERILKKHVHSLIKQKIQYAELLEHYPFYQLIDLASQGLDLLLQDKKLQFVRKEKLKKVTDENVQLVLGLLNEVLALVPAVPEKWMTYFEYLKTLKHALVTHNEDLIFLALESAPDKPRWSNAKPAFDEGAHSIIEKLKKMDLFTTQDTLAYQQKHEEINLLFFQFIKDLLSLELDYKKKKGELTISDLENLSLKLMNEHPQTVSEFSELWDYFMVDEYQDTSPLQVQLLNRILQDKPFFIVGDPQQSIYLFRGARSEVFSNKEHEVKSNNGLVRFLNTNYRTNPSLMNFINHFFKNLSGQFQPMQTRSNSIETNLPADAFFIKAKDESLAALQHIQYLISCGVTPKDICILSRKNSTLIKIAHQAHLFHIPVQLQTANGFESRREILDLIAFVKFLINPHDDENLITLLRSPWLHVDDQSLIDLCYGSETKQYSLWIAISKNNHPIKVSLLKYLNYFEEAGASYALKQWMEQTGFLAFSEMYDSSGKREANVFKFLTSLVSAEKTLDFSLGQFLEDHAQQLQSDLGSSSGEAQPVVQPDRVSLMTVHASKGLQFKHVIVVGLTERPQTTNQMNLAYSAEQSLFSLAVFDEAESKLKSSNWSVQVRKQLNERELQESERVLYVAVTRAEESVSLIAGERKIITNDSWFKKIWWPVAGEEGSQQVFKTASLEYDQDILALKKLDIEAKAPRSQFLNFELPKTVDSAVTKLISKTSDLAPQLDYNKLTLSLQKAQRGTDLHRLFEALKYRDFDHLMSQVNSEEQKYLTYLKEQKEIDLFQILQKGFNEWGFGLKTKNGIRQGQIDAWAELDQEIHLLDYKTGSSFFFDKALDQLSIYTVALLKMNLITKNKKIIHSIIYPAERKILRKQFSNAADFLKQAKPEVVEFFD